MGNGTERVQMRILHAPVNIAGQASIISAYQRKAGFKSDVLLYVDSPYGYLSTMNLQLEGKNIVTKGFLVLSSFIRCLPKYDVFHFHFAESFLPFNFDLPILKLFGKKVVMSYYGSEIRQCDVAARYTYFAKGDLEKLSAGFSDCVKRRRMMRIALFADSVVITDPSLAPYAKGNLIMRAVDSKDPSSRNSLKAASKKKKKTLNIVHAPSNRAIKGTEHVIGAVDRLKKEGFPVKLTLLEKKTNAQVKKECLNADIVIDQLLLETYGVFAIECMAMGKPVMCRIDPSFLESYPGLPVMNTDPSNLYRNLKKLLKSAKLRESMGILGAQYVKKVHDAKK